MYRGSFFSIPLAILTITIYTASGEHCITSQLTLKFYEELNCIPTKDKTKNCATSFNCSSLFNHNKDKCYFGGKEYSIGEGLNDAEHPGNNCIESCRCDNATGSAQFTCLNVQCPEKFKILRDDCMNTYSHEICCATSTLCDDDLRGLATCEYGGKVYKEGAIFYPKEKPCKKCICQEGFDGKIESPWCEDVSCNLEIRNVPDIQEFCAPVYKGRRSCCPSYFYCQSSSNTTIQIIERRIEAGSSSRPRKNHDRKCKFGNMTVEIGQKITPPGKCVECSCDVPPFVTCIRDGKCSKELHNH